MIESWTKSRGSNPGRDVPLIPDGALLPSGKPANVVVRGELGQPGGPSVAGHKATCGTVPMPEFTVLAGPPDSDAEVLALYESVGRTAYTREPEVLAAALRGSSFVVTARSADGGLVGLARAISDDATICYLQDTEGSDFRREPLRVFAQFR
ncbi:hypothetical protein [Arthrobacter sp. PsM3]|uniref:hypothetical protein n=1 Tax=Arthrobacter sp. PsM3 TaxID=3030531 RepID=UPI00263BA959|nr:hypothetical protein [Arthrobacter sp. PsM3]MDN4644772.1 hypothetical protein [Arthrobacter sp. PsM3]